MASIKDALIYLLRNYPSNKKNDLSKARVTKLIYLSDWHQAINQSRQVTNINWYFDNYGPYVNDVVDIAEQNTNLFSITSTQNMFGSPKTTISLKDSTETLNISDNERTSLDHVIQQTSNMNWNDFIKLVYSTYPITTSDRYSFLDLINKANEYSGVAA